MSDKPEKAAYSEAEAKIANAINDAMGYFLTLPYVYPDQKDEFVAKCLELRRAVLRHTIDRLDREAKPRIYKVD